MGKMSKEGPEHFAILTTQRSGSHYLGSVLRRFMPTALIDEFLVRNEQGHDHVISKLCEHPGAPPFQKLQQFAAVSKVPVGLVLMHDQLGELPIERITAGEVDDAFQKLGIQHGVFLYRSDLVDQAISLSKALQTGVWQSSQGPIKRRVRYNHSQIVKLIETLSRQNDFWRNYIGESEINFGEVEYQTIGNLSVADIQKMFSLI